MESLRYKIKKFIVRRGMLVFTFPGQGSQKPGMGAGWVDHPSWELVEYASQISKRDVEFLLLEASAKELTSTRNSQIATFTLSLVILDAIERLGISPSACAGHSLGEYTALVASGALSFEDGLRLVGERGEAMQIANDENEGSMMAVLGLEDHAVEAACRRTEQQVWVANYNAPGQVVVGGTLPSLEQARIILKQMGAKKIIPLAVNGAFHTPLMEPAKSRLRKALGQVSFYDPEIPVVANVDSLAHTKGQEWPALLSAQLTSPVMWSQTLINLSKEPVTAFVEMGPGTVLSGLSKRTIPGIKSIPITQPDQLDSLVEFVAGNSKSLQEYISTHQGERLYMSERLITSPGTGTFDPVAELIKAVESTAISSTKNATFETNKNLNTFVEVGDVIGTVNGDPIRSPFRGILMGLLALPGERVTNGQPVAWLRSDVDSIVKNTQTVHQ